MREIETKRKKTETTFPKRICLLLSRLSYCNNAKCEHFLNRVGRHRAITTYEKNKTKNVCVCATLCVCGFFHALVQGENVEL